MVVNKNYLIHLDDCAVVPFDVNEYRFSDIRLYNITKVIYDPSEDAGAKLVSVHSSLGNFGSKVLLIICGRKNGIHFYLGTNCAKDPETAGVIMGKR